MANEQYASMSSSRVQVDLDVFGGDNEIFICKQCKDPECVKACPVGAIVKEPTLDIWRVDYDICNGCRACVSACPYSAMFFDPVGDRVIKCELCAASGKPACVEVCPTGALRTKIIQR
jgi:Fe-S-cluster-containing dehydrogenase component